MNTGYSKAAKISLSINKKTGAKCVGFLQVV